MRSVSQNLILATKYAFFAGVAIVTNVAAQRVMLAVYSGRFGLYLAMAVGTLAGLLVKYVLDKRYIFYVRVESHTDDIYRFVLYSAMGVITTMIFWGSELAFNAAFQSDQAKYVGAVVGLTIGYFIKYRLDKKFVFAALLDSNPAQRRTAQGKRI